MTMSLDSKWVSCAVQTSKLQTCEVKWTRYETVGDEDWGVKVSNMYINS